jgi:hypothetical protein
MGNEEEPLDFRDTQTAFILSQVFGAMNLLLWSTQLVPQGTV